MFKKIAIIYFLSVKIVDVDAANLPKMVHIDNNSENRIVCHLAFANIQGLSVDAKLAPMNSYHPRVNNERYSACPYDIEIKYEGQSFRIDFGTDFDLESIKKYRYSEPVDSGFFIFNGQDWQGQADTVAAENNIKVINQDDSVLVTGFLSRNDVNSNVKDYCYAIAVVYDSGYATGGICSPKKDRLQAWKKIVESKKLINYQK